MFFCLCFIFCFSLLRSLTLIQSMDSFFLLKVSSGLLLKCHMEIPQTQIIGSLRLYQHFCLILALIWVMPRHNMWLTVLVNLLVSLRQFHCVFHGNLQLLRFFIFHLIILCPTVAYFTFILALLLASEVIHWFALGFCKCTKVPTFSEKEYSESECLNAFKSSVYSEGWNSVDWKAKPCPQPELVEATEKALPF